VRIGATDIESMLRADRGVCRELTVVDPEEHGAHAPRGNSEHVDGVIGG
jgi:hypothetical protein